MGERTTPGPVCGCNDPIREAVCVNTSKAFQETRNYLLGKIG